MTIVAIVISLILLGSQSHDTYQDDSITRIDRVRPEFDFIVMFLLKE